MVPTTVQIDEDTHARLKELKDDLTFDELISLLLDLVSAEEIARARRVRREAYERWQDEVARRVRADRRNERIF